MGYIPIFIKWADLLTGKCYFLYLIYIDFRVYALILPCTLFTAPLMGLFICVHFLYPFLMGGGGALFLEPIQLAFVFV